MLAVGDEALSPFYGSATAVLVLLLITWLVFEARAIREDMVAKRAASEAISRIPGSSILPIGLALSAGSLVGLRVQFHGEVSSWEEVTIWASLGLGFVSVVFSLAHVASTAVGLDGKAALWLARGRKWGALAVATTFGILASPLVHDGQVRLVGAKFAVYGTCLTGGCGLKQRQGPGATFPEAVRGDRLSDGEQVLVVCQTSGPPPAGFKTRVWDLLPNGRYVSDAFVDTPNRSGGFTEGLPRCKPGTSLGTAG